MKTYVRLIAILLLCATSAFAAPQGDSVKWSDDFNAVKAEAKKTNKPILANFTGSDWCPWCIKLEKEILSQKAFQDYAGANLVLFIADFPQHKELSAAVQKQNDDLQNKYNIKGFPTVLLLDADGKVLGKTGYQRGGAESFVADVKDTLNKAGVKPATPAMK